MSIFERYSENARRSMHVAKCEADDFGSLEVGIDHVLLALLSDPAIAGTTMEGISEPDIRAAIRAHIPRREPNPLPHDLPLSGEARTALIAATEKADKFGHRYVQNEHVLLALVESEMSYAAQLLKQKGLSPDKLRRQIKALPSHEEDNRPSSASDESRAESKLIREVGELVSQGKGQRALQLIDDFMAEPGRDRKLSMRLLGHFAAITAVQIGELKAAQRYCEERLACTPKDPMALYALADCLARQGQTHEAKRWALECRQVALSKSDGMSKQVLGLVEKRFPELKERP